MPELGVNIDHVATLRQARKTYEPDPIWAAVLAELGGADGITIHLREDRRHIQDRDLRVLRETVTVKLNLELACNQEVLDIACQVRPDQATLVPERREEVTTEGGLDALTHREAVARAVGQLQAAGIYVSLFLDPDIDQIELAAEIGADAVELHTGQYALARGKAQQEELVKLSSCRAPDSPIRHGLARRSWTKLPQRPAGGGNRRHARTEYRPQYRRPCRHGWFGTGGARDEAIDHGLMVARDSRSCGNQEE